MKILILETYYKPFLDKFYSNKDERNLDFEVTRRKLVSKGFGAGDSYSFYLNQLGYQAKELIINDFASIRICMSRHMDNKFIKSLQLLPYPFYKFVINKIHWRKYCLSATFEIIRKEKPDVLLIRNVKEFPPTWIKEVKKYVSKSIVGQIAYSFDKFQWLTHYDLIISSLPNLVNFMKKRGLNSHFLMHAFDPRLLRNLKKRKKQYDVSFVGGFAPVHLEETKLMEKILKEIPINIWGYGKDKLPEGTIISKFHHGEAWGIKMLNIYYNSKIVFNRHGQVDPVKKLYANNMRLFEATGAGALLLTDHKKNIGDIFKTDKEVVTYKSAEEAVKKIKYYLDNETQRKNIAKSGQKRTLKEHSYKKRMEELVDILNL